MESKETLYSFIFAGRAPGRARGLVRPRPAAAAATKLEADEASSRSFRFIRCVKAELPDDRSGTIEVSFVALIFPSFGTNVVSLKKTPEGFDVLVASVLRFFFGTVIELPLPDDDFGVSAAEVVEAALGADLFLDGTVSLGFFGIVSFAFSASFAIFFGARSIIQR